MRAVNLIPARPSWRHATGSGLARIAIGVLAIVVAMAGAYTLGEPSVSQKRTELRRQDGHAAEAQAEQPPATPRSPRAPEAHRDRASLADSRFDWSRALHEVARTIPSDTWLTSLRGTIAPASRWRAATNDPLRARSRARPSRSSAVRRARRTWPRSCEPAPDRRRRAGQPVIGRPARCRREASGGGDGGRRGHGNPTTRFSMTLFFAIRRQRHAAGRARDDARDRSRSHRHRRRAAGGRPGRVLVPRARAQAQAGRRAANADRPASRRAWSTPSRRRPRQPGQVALPRGLRRPWRPSARPCRRPTRCLRSSTSCRRPPTARASTSAP